jgi:hypothetical protein
VGLSDIISPKDKGCGGAKSVDFLPVHGALHIFSEKAIIRPCLKDLKARSAAGKIQWSVCPAQGARLETRHWDISDIVNLIEDASRPG